MQEGQVDSPPPLEESSNANYQKLRTSLEKSNYTNLTGQPDQTSALVEKISEEFAKTHEVMKITIPTEKMNFGEILSQLTSLAPKGARDEIREELSASMNTSDLIRKTAEVNEKPTLVIIENLENVGQGRDDLIRTVRALYNERAMTEDLKKLTFLLVADQHPTELLNDTSGTPYNVGTNISL